MRKGEDNFYQTMDLNIRILDRNKIWNSKAFLESLNYDKKYVEQLNNWENKTLEINQHKKDNKDNKDNKEKEKEKK